MAILTKRGKLLAIVAVAGIAAALAVGATRLYAQGCGGMSGPHSSHDGSSGSAPVDTSPLPRDYPSDWDVSGADRPICPLEAASLATLAQELDLSSRQRADIARVQRDLRDRAAPIERRIAGDQTTLARTLDADRPDAGRARKLIAALGQQHTDIQMARLDALLRMGRILSREQARGLPACPYLLPQPRAISAPAGPYGYDEHSEHHSPQADQELQHADH